MSDNSSDNKRIAKNTILLYFRMFFMMGVSLYTSRIVLDTLGVVDYGIYSVVGSVIALFTFVSSAMGNATSRYITYTLGTGDKEKLKSVFNTALIIHVILVLIIMVLGETIGLWFLNTHMTIPSERLDAANWLYQFTIVSTMVAIVNVPFMSEIISHEKMSAFAYLSILDVVLKLIIVYFLIVIPYDKLIFYSLMMLCIYLIDIIVYWVYCKRKFPETKMCFLWDKELLKKMTAFAGWSLIGNMVWIGYTQGINVLLNIFCGPAVNAARGIATQVQGAVSGFVTNFQMAVNPQIIKAYAQDNLDRVKELVFSSSKFSFFLLLCISLPIMIEADHILNIWLVEVPKHAVNFVALTLLMLLNTPLENPIGTSNNATGNIRSFQIVAGSISMFIIILGYLLLKLGFAPEWVFVEQFFIVSIVLITKVYMVHRKIQLSMLKYMTEVFIPVWCTAIVSAVPSCVIRIFVVNNMTSLLLNVPITIMSVLLCAYTIGLNKQERVVAKNIALKTARKIFKKA